MGRPRKGELPVGETKPCRYCGVDIYRAPSAAKHCGTFFHLKCIKQSAYNFPCAVCKEPVYTQPVQRKLRARSTCSPACRRSLAKQRAEQRRVLFGATRHQRDPSARYSVEAQEWRKSIFARDDYTCVFCGARGGYLEADHIKPWAFFPDLRFELSNGRTLCRPCHDLTKESYKVMRQKYETDRIQEAR